MSTIVLERLRDLFLTGEAAAGARPARRVAERAVPATLGVLVSPRDAPAAGAALGLAVAAAHRAPCAVVCRWTGAEVDEPPRSGLAGGSAHRLAEPPRSGLAGGPARRLAQRLAARGLVASACGRVVTVALPSADTEARAATERALAVAGEIPLVFTVAGARPLAFDSLLADLDRVIVVPPSGAPAGLERLAIDDAARLGRSAAVLRRPSSGTVTGRLLVVTGLPLSPSWREAAAAALRGDDG